LNMAFRVNLPSEHLEWICRSIFISVYYPDIFSP
jgi:hypothetical protein